MYGWPGRVQGNQSSDCCCCLCVVDLLFYCTFLSIPFRLADNPDASQDAGIEQTLTQGSVALLLRCAYLCAQGVLAGFAFVSVYSLATVSAYYLLHCLLYHENLLLLSCARIVSR